MKLTKEELAGIQDRWDHDRHSSIDWLSLLDHAKETVAEAEIQNPAEPPSRTEIAMEMAKALVGESGAAIAAAKGYDGSVQALTWNNIPFDHITDQAVKLTDSLLNRLSAK